jgi:hypothetical protein
MAHYYNADGEPCFKQITASGPRKGLPRDTTKADARKLGLFPSVSEYISVMSNHGLMRYKINQVISAAYYRPVNVGESLEDYASIITEIASKDSDEASELGTAIHDAIEAHYTGREINPAYNEYVQPTVELLTSLGIEPVAAEKILVNPEYGYAGMTDIVYDRGILDFKSQRFAKKPNSYDSHIMQIAAYHMAQFGAINDDDVGYNIYISTVNVGLVVEKKWNANELRNGWELFRYLLNVYRLKNKFDARQGAMFN